MFWKNTLRMVVAAFSILVVAVAFTACSASARATPEETPAAPARSPGDEPELTFGQHLGRYFENVWWDFCDALQIGGGVTLTNAESGWPKPYPGFYFQMTDFLKFGAMHYYGWSAEWDGRGFFAGPEARTRFSFGPLDALRIDQKYDRGWENYFKKSRTFWSARMQSNDMMWGWTPAKELRYDIWAKRLYTEKLCFHRGWQHWSNSSLEVGMIFVQLRMGLDIVELHEWVLSLFAIDVLGDDLTPREYLEKHAAQPTQALATDPARP